MFRYCSSGKELQTCRANRHFAWGDFCTLNLRGNQSARLGDITIQVVTRVANTVKNHMLSPQTNGQSHQQYPLLNNQGTLSPEGSASPSPGCFLTRLVLCLSSPRSRGRARLPCPRPPRKRQFGSLGPLNKPPAAFRGDELCAGCATHGMSLIWNPSLHFDHHRVRTPPQDDPETPRGASGCSWRSSALGSRSRSRGRGGPRSSVCRAARRCLVTAGSHREQK